MEPHFPMVKSNRATRLLGSPGWFVHQLQISLVGLKPRTDRGMEKPGMGWVAHLLGSNFVETMFDGKKKIHRFGFKSMSCFVLFFSSKVDNGKIYHMFQYGINRDLRVQVLLLQWLLSLKGVYIIWMDFVLIHQRFFCALESQGGAQSWFTSLN